MKKFKLYNVELKKIVKSTLFAMSFLGAITLTGCNNKSTTVKSTKTVETTQAMKESTVAETTTASETKETTTEAQTETISIPVIESTEQSPVETKESNEDEYDFPSEPEKFQSAEELVVYVEEDTKVLRKVIADGNRTKYESKMVYLLIKMKNFSKEKESWNGINYSDLNQEQKQRYESCSSIWKDMLKDNVNDLGRSLKDAFGEFYGDDTDQVSENLNEIKDNFGQFWDATKKNGKEKYEDIKQGEAYQNAEEKVKDGASKAKQKIKDYLK